MILMHVTYELKPETRDIFYAAVKAHGIPEKSRAEDGNLGYDYFYPVESDDTLLLIEVWRDEPSLLQHQQAPHFLELQTIKQQYVLNAAIERYDVK